MMSLHVSSVLGQMRIVSLVIALFSAVLIAPMAQAKIVVLIDSTGDHLPDADPRVVGTRAFAGGQYHGVILHNNDDDNADGIPDDDDDQVNGMADVLDMFPITLEVNGLQDTDLIVIRSQRIDHHALGIFQQKDQNSYFSLPIQQRIPLAVNDVKANPLLLVEAKRFANKDWNGEFSLLIEVVREGEIIEVVTLDLRVAPWLMLSNASPAETLYVREFIDRNELMLAQLREHLPQSNTQLHVISGADEYAVENIWLQDTMEIGRQYAFFRSMPVVLQANRNKDIDRFSREALLGSDFGWFRWGQYRDEFARGISGVGWMDWFGNLEVSPPLPQYPHGRVYFGEAGDGNQLNPEIVDNIAAQALQDPFSLDVSYLMIKHVDETLSWLPGADNRWYALVPSPSTMLELAYQYRQQGHGDVPILTPFVDDFTLNAMLADQDTVSFNQSLEAGVLQDNINRLKLELGLADDQIIKIPAYFNPDGTSLFPNMVNSALVNGTFLVPDPHGPSVGGMDLLQQSLRNILVNMAVDIVFVDDQQYHRWWGNVHCATNVTRSGIEHIMPLSTLTP